MKLFSPKEVAVVSSKKKDEDIAQIAYLTKTLDGLQKSINKENDAFRLRLSEQREVYSKEKEQLQKEIQELTEITQGLRAERRQLMIPVETLKAEADIMHKETEKRLASIQQKEEETDELLSLLHTKLDDISSRESIIKEAEMALKIKVSGIEAEREQVSDSHIRLNQMMAEFSQNVQTKTKELSAKQDSLKQQERLMQATLAENDKYFSEQHKLLNDKRGALDRLYKQTNKK
jgi:uncharacterized coiled-coil DUF342 family protein